MIKIKYFLTGMAILLLMSQVPTPQYLYRNLSIRSPGYALVDVMGITSNLVYWLGGSDVVGSNYYESNGVDDDLYGYFSIPVRECGAQVVMDSIFLCFWTQGNEDEFNANLYYGSCGGASHGISSVLNLGDGSSGWEKEKVLDASHVVVDSCYFIYLDCTNNGATDIRVSYCMQFMYHLDTLQ